MIPRITEIVEVNEEEKKEVINNIKDEEVNGKNIDDTVIFPPSDFKLVNEEEKKKEETDNIKDEEVTGKNIDNTVIPPQSNFK